MPEALWVDLLSPDQFRSYSARPERLRELVAGNPDSHTIVIDEIQRAPALLDVVHSLLQERRGHRFVLTGSSARKLKRTGVDLLAGRALLRTLHPFMAAELGPGFDLDRALHVGLLPVVLDSPNPADALAAYAALCLREEVQQEGLLRNIGGFSRFLESISFSHASVLNVSDVARECEVGRKAVEGYVSILEDLLLAFRLPVFSKRAGRDLAKHPKLFLFDAGVYRALRPAGPLDRPEEIEGAALEGLVAQHLRAWIAYSRDGCDLSYWRTPSGTEVDFVVHGAGGFWAVDVKNTSAIRSRDLRPLMAFQEDYPESKTIFLYRGKDRLRRDGVLCVPVSDFLLRLQPGEGLEA